MWSGSASRYLRVFLRRPAQIASVLAILVLGSLGAVLHTSSAQSPAESTNSVIHLVWDDYSRQKHDVQIETDFPKTWRTAETPDQTRSESWLLVSGNGVLQSVGITRDLAGRELQRTIQTPEETWIYNVVDGQALHLGPAPLGKAAVRPQPSGVITQHRVPVSPELLEEQQRNAYVRGYMADLNPVEVLIEVEQNPSTGTLVRETRSAIDDMGQGTVIFERKNLLSEELPATDFTPSFWTFTPPAGTEVFASDGR